MRKLLFKIRRKDLKSVLFKIFIFIIVFSILGYAISLIFPRTNPAQSPTDKPAVNKSTYWKDKNGTVSKDVEYITNTNSYNFLFSDEYSKYGISPKKVLLSKNGWNLIVLNKNYILPVNYELDLQTLTGTSVRLESVAADAFNSMYIDALKSNLTLTAYSGYRSFESQRRLFENKIYALELQASVEYLSDGSYDAQGNYVEPVKKEMKTIVGDAAKYVCPPGCSDHNAGLSIDIVSQNDDFADTDEFAWLNKNAHNYGFVLRYPEGKEKQTGMVFQPYCWRFVGINAAKEMKEKNLCLEEYMSGVLQ